MSKFSLLLKYQKYQHIPSVKSINAFYESRMSILQKYQKHQYLWIMKSVNSFQISILFTYEYISNINTFQSTKHIIMFQIWKAATCFKYQKNQCVSSIKTISTSHISEVLILSFHWKNHYFSCINSFNIFEVWIYLRYQYSSSINTFTYQ